MSRENELIAETFYRVYDLLYRGEWHGGNHQRRCDEGTSKSHRASYAGGNTRRSTELGQGAAAIGLESDQTSGLV